MGAISVKPITIQMPIHMTGIVDIENGAILTMITNEIICLVALG